jgi:hypothetical protein
MNIDDHRQYADRYLGVGGGKNDSSVRIAGRPELRSKLMEYIVDQRIHDEEFFGDNYSESWSVAMLERNALPNDEINEDMDGERVERIVFDLISAQSIGEVITHPNYLSEHPINSQFERLFRLLHQNHPHGLYGIYHGDAVLTAKYWNPLIKMRNDLLYAAQRDVFRKVASDQYFYDKEKSPIEILKQSLDIKNTIQTMITEGTKLKSNRHCIVILLPKLGYFDGVHNSGIGFYSNVYRLVYEFRKASVKGDNIDLLVIDPARLKTRNLKTGVGKELEEYVGRHHKNPETAVKSLRRNMRRVTGGY